MNGKRIETTLAVLNRKGEYMDASEPAWRWEDHDTLFEVLDEKASSVLQNLTRVRV